MSIMTTFSLLIALASCTEVAVNPITTPVTGGETETGQTTTMSTNTSSTVTTSTTKTTTTTGKQSFVDCLDILISGKSIGDGVYDIDPLATGAYEVYCVMDATYDGGGWTLAAVSSDDGQDTWTWNNRHYWDTDTTTFGVLGSLNEDFKSAALHEVGMTDMLFIHSPSSIWAVYSGIVSSEDTFDMVSLAHPSKPCLDPVTDGYAMTDGTLSITGGLCDTYLYFHAGDCFSGDDNAYGPSWNSGDDNGTKCPFDDPGNQSSLGPNDFSPTSEMSSLGFGALGAASVGGGLNTGGAGIGENYMWVLVRR